MTQSNDCINRIEGMHHWCYDDDDIEHGPASWPTGTKQSPIDIDLACVQRIDTPDAIKFINYEHAIKGDICNNGHSVQMNPIIQCQHPEIYGGGLDQVYQLVQYHFHWGPHDNSGNKWVMQHQMMKLNFRF